MFLFCVLSFFVKGDTIQGGHYSRGDIISGNTLIIIICTAALWSTRKYLFLRRLQKQYCQDTFSRISALLTRLRHPCLAPNRNITALENKNITDKPERFVKYILFLDIMVQCKKLNLK